jgi:phasin family protein
MELVMSSLAPEQLVAAQKTSVETMFGILNKAFDGIEKLVELNAQVVKSTLAENQEILSKALSAKEPHELYSQQAIQTQPAIEKARSYWRHVYEILSSTQSEVAALAEARFKKHQNDAQAFIDSLAKNAPAGSGNAVTA